MSEWLQEVRLLQSAGARFLALWAEDCGQEVQLVYYFLIPDGAVQVLHRQSRSRSVDSIYSLFGCADWSERDASKRYRLRFVGNPNIAPGSEASGDVQTPTLA
jgi:NADH:ubiquinone oxidoreductase subunit C